MVPNIQTISPGILSFVQELPNAFSDIPSERKEILLKITRFVEQQLAAGKSPELIFICTHNSRRSHFGQIWAKVFADYYGFSAVRTYSGGTEATAFNPNAIEALRSIGFEIVGDGAQENPRYEVKYGPEIAPLQAWSKTFSDPANPQEDFCAIMTCSEADEACPYVPGASSRVSLPFEDPKKSDGTPEQTATYALRCQQIATELAFAFSQISSDLST